MLKYLKFCCDDHSSNWDIPDTVIDYCVGSVSLVSDFLDCLQEKWKVVFAGTIGYECSGHLLDFRRIHGQRRSTAETFIAAKVYMNSGTESKRTYQKRKKAQWNVLFSVDYLSHIGCLASLEEMQQVIPYHGDRFSQIPLNASTKEACVPSHNLTFCTSYMVAILFLMTYQFLTVSMVKNFDCNGIIDQTVFKAQEKYRFVSLIFSEEVLRILNGYIVCIRPCLNNHLIFQVLYLKHQ